ncbi:MAG: hypothetical protein IKT67_11555 [Lachnospiraceae bacterium]|nr:hypothetical protein [Lachnospiraceae bacterium]
MILFITAIMPEAKAVLSAFPMKKMDFTFPLYETEDNTLRLLITGPGKLSAAMAVTAYLTRYEVSAGDVFCNFGICGGSGDTVIGDGYLCAALTELTTGKALYPELYTHPFSEARLITADVPVKNPSTPSEPEGNLPLLYDMEAYGVATALFRSIQPSHCFFYKVVSDVCNGTFPSPEDVVGLIQPHLNPLLGFLSGQETQFTSQLTRRNERTGSVLSLTKEFMADLPFSTTMERRLTELITYALSVGLTRRELLSALPERTDTPHKKREALARLETLEAFVKNPKQTGSQNVSSPEPDSASFLSTQQPEKKLLRPFRHIYVEREVLSHTVTKQFTERFKNAAVIPIDHYKDVFNRSRQDLHAQETGPALILAANHGTLFYPGAPVCQSFGEEHFMYTSCIMNCLYDCDYCYLQGMYPSGTIVVFVNLEDYFAELDRLLKKHPVYLCCSYDSDLTALCGLLPHAEAFCRYALTHPDLRLELRTKSAALPFIKELPAAKNIVMAFTLSPQEIITRYEHYTPSLKARLTTAKEAAKKGFSLRLCFDPVLDVPNAPELYTTLVDETFSVLSTEEITDISLGVFRLSKDYVKQLKKAKPSCAISHYPYTLTDGVCHYDTERCDKLLTSVKEALARHHIPDDKLFIWTPEESVEGDSHVNQ